MFMDLKIEKDVDKLVVSVAEFDVIKFTELLDNYGIFYKDIGDGHVSEIGYAITFDVDLDALNILNRVKR